MAMRLGPAHSLLTAPADGHKGWTEMDPLGTLLVSLGTLIVLDLAARQLGAPRRPRTRTRAIRSR
jgi:hypothetical protein